MSLLLYGIIFENAPLAIDSELQIINAAGLAAIVKNNICEISREPAVIIAYGEQIKHIHQQTTLIPIRYGSELATEQEVIAYLTSHAEHYQTRLKELIDCEEMGIRLPIDSTEDNQTSKPISGYDYLLARKRVYAIPEQVEQQATLINNALAGLYRQHCAELSVFNGQRTYLLSYLVPRAELSFFRERLIVLIDQRFISGPWPPYNFSH
jgi:hypothetical protein